jgi:chromate transporter
MPAGVPPERASPERATPERGRLAELARVFLRLGATSFGGPAAHVALMEDELVARRRWLGRGEFLDLVGATNLIPGPNSTELAIHIGRLRGGWPGLLVAGVAFILPAALVVTALAWGYVRWGRLPAVEEVLYGVKPAVVAVVLQALWRLGRTALSTRRAWGIAVAATAAIVAGADEIAVLAAAAAVGAALAALATGGGRRVAIVAPLVGAGVGAGAVGGAPTAWPILAFFLKVGSVLFGSGYVLLAFLRTGLVTERHWLTEGQLLDAVAVGQITPGPLFTTATFVGYLLAGAAGAAAATVGIFLPAFVLVAASGPLIPRIRRSPAASAALDAVNAASLALMAVVTAQLARAALVDWPTAAVAAASGALLLRWRVNAAWIVLGAGLVGLVARRLGGA